MPDTAFWQHARMQRLPCPLVLATLLLCFCLPARVAFACEPAAFDFDAYLRDHDRDRNGALQLQELRAASSGVDARYGAMLDVPVNTRAAFNAWDANRDRRLTSSELWAWDDNVHNACADWPGDPTAQACWRRLWSELEALLARWFG